MIAARVRSVALACAVFSCAHDRGSVALPAKATPTSPAVAEPHADAREHSRPASLQEQLVLRQLMRETERIRGLSFRSPVAMHVEDAQGMRAYVRRALDDADIARSRRRYLALGLIRADLDIRELLEQLLEEELIGYYDPLSKRLVVRDDLAASLNREAADASALIVRETLVHELVHALQDQHLGLSARLHLPRTTDAENAYAALVEGDAQLAMLAYALRATGRTLDGALAEDPLIAHVVDGAGVHVSGAMANAPALVREPLLFRYREGAQYAAYLYRQGGFAQIDAVHGAPPLGTAQLLAATHGSPASSRRALVPPQHACVADAGFQRVDEDTLGGLEIAIVVADGSAVQGALARAVLADRYEVFQRGEAVAAVWIVQLESAALALRVGRALTARAALKPGRLVFRRGDRLLVTTGLAPRCADQLAASESLVRLP